MTGRGTIAKLLRRRKPEPERVFTGNCMVRCFTMDGYPIGRCHHSTYGGVCPTHGDVGAWLPADPLSDDGWKDWPRETELLSGGHGGGQPR